MNAPILSLITGKVGRDASFQRLVDSIVAHTDVEWELVCSDASEVPYGPTLPNIRVLHENPRVGFAAGYNRAFREARGEWCIWLNDDAEVMPGYASEAVRFMESHPQIGLGALHFCDPGEPFHVCSAWDVVYPNFGIFKTAIGAKLGFFGTDVTMYGADNAITFEFLLNGYGVSDIPTAKVKHYRIKDDIRRENQLTRFRDSDILTAKYMPSRRLWQQTFRLNYVNTGTIPWSHGVEPKVMSVVR